MLETSICFVADIRAPLTVPDRVRRVGVVSYGEEPFPKTEEENPWFKEEGPRRFAVDDEADDAGEREAIDER